MTSLWRDIHYGARMLVRKPASTVVAVITLALGIALTTATFTVVDAVLLRKLPVNDPNRVVVIHNQLPKINLPRTQVSALQYLDYSRQTDVFESTAAFGMRNFNLTGVSQPERLQAGRVTASFFATLGVNAAAGRFFTTDEDKVGNDHVAVLSTALRKRLFATDGAALENAIQLSGENYKIVGVAPEGMSEIYPNFDVWIPMAFTARELSEDRRTSLAFRMLGRLRPDVSIQRAQTSMTAVARSTAGSDTGSFNIEVRSLTDEYVGDVRRPLFVLLCAVITVLLISCANVANLLLARATTRGHEIAVRTALGAGRSRIVQQLLTESLLIALVGGVLGVLFALWGTRGLLALAPNNLPRLSGVQIDLNILLSSIGVSLVCGVIFGLAPALIASRTNLVTSLKESERTESGGGTRHWLRKVFVVAEVAMALVLLISAGLLVRSFNKLLRVEPGFDPHNLLTVRVSLPATQYNNATKVAAFYDGVLERVSALPGVVHAAAAFQTPFTQGGDSSMFHIRDRHAGADEPGPHADYAFVSADYFKSIGLPILKGRDFQSSDMRAGNYFAPNSVAIIDEELAKRYWPNGDALGGGLSWSEDGPWATVVGICATAHLRDLTEDSKGTLYLPSYFSSSTLVVRTTGDPHALASAVREQVLAVDSNQPIYDVKTMDERVALTLGTHRFAVVLLAIFGAVALLLAAIGLYGVLAFTVSQRTREIGIRMSLGARGRDVLLMVVRQGMSLVLVGIALGLLGAYALTRTVRSLLFEVAPTDALTFLIVPLLLAVVAFIACYLPARRATKVDPLEALRYE
jgi:putative ABC transport system permease protein